MEVVLRKRGTLWSGWSDQRCKKKICNQLYSDYNEGIGESEKGPAKGSRIYRLKGAHRIVKTKTTKRLVQPGLRLMRRRSSRPGGTYANLLVGLNRYQHLAARKRVGEVVTSIYLEKGRWVTPGQAEEAPTLQLPIKQLLRSVKCAREVTMNSTQKK